METLKIAMFSWESLDSVRVGGMASAVSELSRAIAGLGQEVHLFTRMASGQADYDCYEGVHIHRCPFEPGGGILWECEKMCHSMVERLNATREMVGGFDIAHGHDWHVVNALNQLKVHGSLPYALSFHSTEWGRNGGSFGEWYEFQEISGREWYGSYSADRLITVSNTMKDELIWLYGVPDDKVDVIPNGVVPEHFKKEVDPGLVKKRFGIHHLAPIVLFIGRLAHQKGPDILMGAVPKVLDHRWDAVFIFAGEGGMRGHLEYLADLFNIGRAVRILGYVPQSDYLDLLNASDIVCIPSRNEPFGLVLLEAWSARKAVVASDVGGLRENIDNFKNGIKVRPTSDSVAWGIKYIINDRACIRSLGTAGFKKLKKNFSWKGIARSTMKTYKKVLT